MNDDDDDDDSDCDVGASSEFGFFCATQQNYVRTYSNT